MRISLTFAGTFAGERDGRQQLPSAPLNGAEGPWSGCRYPAFALRAIADGATTFPLTRTGDDSAGKRLSLSLSFTNARECIFVRY